MPDGKRLWRTASGDLVEDGHPEAVTLAYGADDALVGADKKRRTKRAAKPADKQVDKPADK
jgi:hypothetical protein